MALSRALLRETRRVLGRCSPCAVRPREPWHILEATAAGESSLLLHASPLDPPCFESTQNKASSLDLPQERPHLPSPARFPPSIAFCPPSAHPLLLSSTGRAHAATPFLATQPRTGTALPRDDDVAPSSRLHPNPTPSHDFLAKTIAGPSGPPRFREWAALGGVGPSSTSHSPLTRLTFPSGQSSTLRCLRDGSGPRLVLGAPGVVSELLSGGMQQVPVRCFAQASGQRDTRRSSRGKQEQQGARETGLTSQEDIFDTITDKIPERPVSVAEGASYSVVILVALAVAGGALYYVLKELLFEPKEYKVFNRALLRVQRDAQVVSYLGSPITGYGQESRNRAARQRISNKVWKDEDGIEKILVQFHIRGPGGAGLVHCEMFKDPEENHQLQYTYLVVDITSPTPRRLMLESYVPKMDAFVPK